MGSDSRSREMGSSKSAGRNPLRPLLGLGFWIQGFRCFPWMGVNFFLKDSLGVAPATLQILQTSANLPMVGKPLYGILSDAVYFRGEHRLPYISIGVFLQAVSWMSIALLPHSSLSLLTISLLLGNLGASIVEVANDALVAESSKQPSAAAPSGSVQSFVWMMGSVGGILGNLLGGVAINLSTTPGTMFLCFAFLLILQLLATLSVRERSLDLPKVSSSSRLGIKKQLSELSTALKESGLSHAIAWFAASYAVIPILTGTVFFYQTQHLEITSFVLGLSKVFGQAAMLLWIAAYNRWLKKVRPRKLISAVQLGIAVFMLSDALFVKEVYRAIGVSDAAYVVIFSGLQEVLFQFKVLPFVVLVADLCPSGCEGSVMAFLMSAVALSTIVSGYLGVALAAALGISAHDFSRLPLAILMQAAWTMVPLFWASWIPDGIRHSKEE